MFDLIPAVVVAGGIGLIASFLLELLLHPRAIVPWRRHWTSLCVHAGIWFLWFGVALALVHRPVFSTVIGLALLMLIVMVNNAKFHSLREPFLAQDFEYFTDAIRHPRLYIPFLGWGRAISIAVAVIAAIAVGLVLEPSLFSRTTPQIFWLHSMSSVVIGVFLLCLGHLRSGPVCYQPESDLYRLGLLAYLWRYWRDEQRKIDVCDANETLPELPDGDAHASLPDLVVIQSESFFDPRRSFSGLRSDLLSAFDCLKTESVDYGQLQVPAWGANTVRSEFAFLSGRENASLGVHQFNPYRRFVWSCPETIATRLRAAGYRTVCIHPYPASFYTRNRVYPKIGFDEFIDIGAFENAPKSGPYVGDQPLAERVIQELRCADDAVRRPLFVFVITMENHGPLHLERVAAGDVARLYRETPPAGCDDLTIYARHLENADKMFSSLRSHLLKSSRDAILCIYGDHVPIMPTVYAQLAVPDGTTDFVIWRNRRIKQNADLRAGGRTVPLDTLARRLLEEIAR